MDDVENINSILADSFPYIDEFLGEMVDAKLKIPNYEKGLLTSQLLEAAHKASLNKKESDDEDYSGFDDEYYASCGYKLDPGRYLLDRNLYFGQKNCDGFNFIFPTNNIFKKQQEADNKITEILAQVKCCEFLSIVGFKNITKVDQWKNKMKIDFKARKLNDYYAVVVTHLYSGKYIEEHINEYNESSLIRSLANDISYSINQKYPLIA